MLQYKIMKGELRDYSQENHGTSQWDALRPENNGIGEFDSTSAEAKSEGLEVEPIMVDAHDVARTWDPDMTSSLACNVLDEYWLPDLDDGRPNEITIDERFKELHERAQFLDDLEDYLRNPRSEDDWKFVNIDKTVEDFRKEYLNQIERQQANPDEPNIDIAVRNMHNCLVMVRTYQYLASDPEERRKEIEYEQAGLGQILAARDERYRSAFSETDQAALKQNIDKILERIPKVDFQALAKLIDESGTANEAFTTKTLEIIEKSLGLDPDQLEFDTFNDPDSTLYGNCRNLGEGRSLIRLNQAKVSNAVQFANTSAHEIFHAKQHEVQYTGKGQPAGEFYDYCFAYYIPPEFDYNKYITQYTEAEAFYFGNEFSKRVAQARVRGARQKSLAKRLGNLIRRK